MGVEVDARDAGAGITGGWTFHAVRRRLSRNSLLRHNVLLFAATMVTSVFSYLFHPVVGHLLGPQGYGSIGSLLSLGAVLLIPIQSVIYIANKSTAELIAQDRAGQLHYLLRRTIRYAVLIGLLLALIFVALSPVLTRFLKLSSSEPVIILGLSYILALAAPLNSGVIQGRQQFGWFALLNFLTAFLRVVTTAAALLAGFGVNGILWVSLLNGALLYAITFVPLRDIFQSAQERIPSLKPLFTYSIGATLTLAAGTLLTNTDTILAKHYLSSTDAGYYIALTKIGQSVLFVSGSLVWVMFPKVAALKQKGEAHRDVLLWTMAGVFVLSSAVLFIFWLFPSQIITLIFHAPASISDQLFPYGLAMLLLALSNVLIYYFLSLGAMRFVPLVILSCCLQAALIVAYHASVAQIVTVMVAVMAILCGGLSALYVMQQVRMQRTPTLEQPT